MSIDETPAADPNVAPPAEEHEDEGLVQTVRVGDQQMAPVSEVIRFRKEARAARKELEALKPQIERANQIGQQLQELEPVLQTVRSLTPQQRETLASGKLPSAPGTTHNTEDVEARQVAEDYGLIASDGSLDISRARKILDKNAERIRQEVQQIVAPLRQTTHEQMAGNLRQQAKAVTDAGGLPMATPESIDEAYKLLPPELASQPNVAMVAIGTAMLIDRMRGRVPKVTSAPFYGDPIYSEPVGNRRGAAPAITAEERDIAKRLGLTDADLTAATTAMRSSGRGIKME